MFPRTGLGGVETERRWQSEPARKTGRPLQALTPEGRRPDREVVKAEWPGLGSARTVEEAAGHRGRDERAYEEQRLSGGELEDEFTNRRCIHACLFGRGGLGLTPPGE